MSKTITKREYILSHFTILRNDLQNTGLFENDIFPDMDASDICMFFRMYFDPHNNGKDIATITELIESKTDSMTEQQKNTVINIILPFLEVFRKMSSTH